MKALVKRSAEPGIWMENVPMPAVSTNEVPVKVEKTAICGTDLHIYNWDDWSQRTIHPPLVKPLFQGPYDLTDPSAYPQ